jgi:Na+-driven multidrug efflux pump
VSAATLQPRLVAIAYPLYGELALGMAAGIVGTVLAARVSDSAGAAFGLANQVFAMVFLAFRIVGAGIGVVVARGLGSGRPEVARSSALAALGASTWFGVVIALLAFAGAYALLGALNAPGEILPLAAPLLQWLAPSLLLDAWNASMASVMRAHLRVRDTLAVIVVMHATHLALALLLMPAMGLTGFALALGASRVAGLALHLWLWRVRLGIVPRASDWWRLPRAELGEIVRIGLPGAAENAAYRLAFLVSVAVAGFLGTQALATQAYVLQLNIVALLFGLAIGLAAEIVVGHLVGARLLREAQHLVLRALAAGLAISVAAATAAALAGPWLLTFFTRDASIIAAGTTLLWITVLLEPGRTFNLVVINALRAAGDARYPVVAGAASMAIVLAGGSWWLGVHLGLGLAGVWIAYAADEWVRGILMWRRWASLEWIPHARAAHRRLRHSTRLQGRMTS